MLTASRRPAITDPTARDAISRLELGRYMRNQLLRDGDTMSMAWGLELRVPFLDGPLVDTLSAIPAGVRLQPAKTIAACRRCPRFRRGSSRSPSAGSCFHSSAGSTTNGKRCSRRSNADCPVPTETWYRKWCLFVFSRWTEHAEAERS